MSSTSWESIQIDSLSMSLAEYLEKVEAGQTEEMLEPFFEGKTTDQIEAFMDQLRADLDEVRDELDAIYDGASEEEIDTDEEEEELDELDNELDEVEARLDLAENAMEEVETQWSMYNIASDQDLALSTIEYYDLDPTQSDITINITALGETVEYGDTEEEVTDQDGDGFITGLDAQIQADAARAAELEAAQDFFITLTSDDIVQSISDTEIVIYNAVKGKTFHLMLSGGTMNLRFQAPVESCVPPSSYAGCSEDLLRRIFIGEGATESVWEIDNPEEMSDLIAETEGYDKIASDENLNLAVSYVSDGVDTALVKDLAKQSIDKLFELLNTTETTATLSGAWADIQALLVDQPPEVAAAVVETLVLALTFQGGEPYFKSFLTGTVPSIIETIILEKGTLTDFDYSIFTMLEMQSGSAGKYGGPNLLIPVDGATTQQVEGSVFLMNSAGGVSLVHEDWADLETVVGGLELYQDLLIQSGWMADDGKAQSIIDMLNENIAYNDQGTSATMNQGLLTDLNNADGWYWSNSEDEISQKGDVSCNADGISDDELRIATDLGIDQMQGIAEAAESLSFVTMLDMVNILRVYLDGLTEDKGDIAASIIFTLSKRSPDFLKAMFVADLSFGSYLSGLMTNENRQGNLIEETLGIVSSYQSQADQVRASME